MKDPAIIGVILLLAVALAAILLVRRRGRSRSAGAPRTPAPDMLGKDLGGYRLVEKLGGGGMGAVYRGEPLAAGRNQVQLA